ncbi:MAG TPA: ribosome biogenesis GTPase Der, partial [Acidimicrobiaceae bacterium]|nr:ribosome biogenesis GTPase Der [Acidimicrobiaceae bacterium]
WELMSLGLGEPSPVSALHGRGAGDLLDRLVSVLPDDDDDEINEEEDENRVVGVALV